MTMLISKQSEKLENCFILNLAYLIEQNQTKIQLNLIEHQSCDWVWQSNKIKQLFCCKFDYHTNWTGQTKSDAIKFNLAQFCLESISS